MKFLDLPVDVLPVILHFVVKSSHLASACLVNKEFSTFATPLLYDSVCIYSWHIDGKKKVLQLFETLRTSTNLAQLVFCLDIRDFPKFALMKDLQLLSGVVEGLRNCKNLTSCTWTRQGSLTSEILEALLNCPELGDLEINGHHSTDYEPRILLRFVRLKRISIIMPSPEIIRLLPLWLAATSSCLRNLTLVCKSSASVTDELLANFAPHLANLDHFQLIGCPRVSEKGVCDAISQNKRGLLSLGLEAISPRFDVRAFANTCSTHRYFDHLRSITITVPDPAPESWAAWAFSIIELLSGSPLQVFQLYHTTLSSKPILPDDLWHQLLFHHAHRLTKISVHRLAISPGIIQLICANSFVLEHFFFTIEATTTLKLAECLSPAKRLRTVHINEPSATIVTISELVSIIDHCPSTISQFGWNTRVWRVRRTLDEDRTCLSLERYENPDIPEQFLVVRT
ncbi:hypothetical protein CPB83DRAFT_849257 [Crepidotus variabilis]|uniref:F-box domain-containing protein n=1 Tax=Crepidotus variabilis TaxID=179855 RepID=A0A9P6JRP8_9AGAR|nr:hypothetical protein CPB83DRAFT_849257 [Crepidotus variabilis]